jgi:RNA polymerase sigma-70 factor (ECF subfamily)
MDDSRFGAVVSPHIKNMVYLAIAMLGQADAEDAVQEALVRAWQAQSRLREGDTVRAWLLTITANVCRDLLRGRHGTRERDPGSNHSAERFDLRQLVDLLEENLREIVVLRFYVEMNATEIGAVLGLPPSTIRTRLQRALTHLRTLIAQHEVYLQPRVNS